MDRIITYSAAAPAVNRRLVYFDVLRRVRDETLRLVVIDHEPFVAVEWRPAAGGSWRRKSLILRDSPRGKSYWFLQVQSLCGTKKKKIALHRLVWLLANDRVAVPAEFDIHHIDQDTWNCRPENLELLPQSVNRFNRTSFGYGANSEVDF